MNRSLLKPLTKASSEALSVYIVPGLGGHPLQFRPLASQLLPQTGLVGVLYPILAGDDTSVTTLQELASRMAIAFDDVKTPIILCGHSFGGTIAYEIACQLRRQNRQVGVVLLDTAVGSLRRKRGRIYRGLRNIFIAWPLLLVGIRKPLPLADNQTEYPQSPEFSGQCRVAARNFKPAKTDIPIVLIRAEASGRMNWLWNRYWPSKDYGWSKVAPVLGVISCPGNHVTIVHKESLSGLAKAMDQATTLVCKRVENLPAVIGTPN